MQSVSQALITSQRNIRWQTALKQPAGRREGRDGKIQRVERKTERKSGTDNRYEISCLLIIKLQVSES